MPVIIMMMKLQTAAQHQHNMTVAIVDDNMADCMQYNRDLVLFAKLRNVSLFSKCQDFEESSELYLLLRIFYYAFYSHIHHVLIRLMTWYDTHFHDCTLLLITAIM